MKKTILFVFTALLGGLLAACLPKPQTSSNPVLETPVESSPTLRAVEPQMSQTAQPSRTDTPAPSITVTETTTPDPTVTEPFLPPTPIVSNTPQSTTTPSADWKLVWADEFNQPDGSPVNAKNWSFETGGGGWGNNELECYTDRTANASVQNGELVIKSTPENYLGCAYTSARLVTKGKADWTYGRFEIKAKLPQSKGLWPAIWMLPTDNAYGGWPDSGEIDIMELLGDKPYKIYGTLHYGSPHTSQGGEYDLTGSSATGGASFADDFHVFSFEWEPQEMRWFVDGFLYFSTHVWNTSGPEGDFPAPFNRRFHLVLNVAVGGAWPGSPDETTTWPQSMTVDYVRVYKK